MGGKLGTEVGVNNCFVTLIATESVSIAIPWPLLPLEVSVNRHGLLFLLPTACRTVSNVVVVGVCAERLRCLRT